MEHEGRSHGDTVGGPVLPGASLTLSQGCIRRWGVGQFFDHGFSFEWVIPGFYSYCDIQGKVVRACVYFLSPRRSLAPSLQIGLCGFNAFHPCPLSQPPTVPAQILPSALRGDVIQWGAGPPRTLSKHGAVCGAQKGKGFPSSPCSCEDHTCGILLPFPYREGEEGISFVIHIQICNCFVFILLWRGLERICEYQTKVCSPGGSAQTHRPSEVEGTISIIWSDWGLEGEVTWPKSRSKLFRAGARPQGSLLPGHWIRQPLHQGKKLVSVFVKLFQGTLLMEACSCFVSSLGDCLRRDSQGEPNHSISAMPGVLHCPPDSWQASCPQI